MITRQDLEELGYIELSPGHMQKPPQTAKAVNAPQVGVVEIYETDRQTSRPEPQPPVRHEPLEAASGAAQDANRSRLCITSYRRRLLDPDNLTPKYFIDALRYFGVIADDTAQDIDLSIRQTKVATPEEERTEIEISHDNNKN